MEAAAEDEAGGEADVGAGAAAPPPVPVASLFRFLRTKSAR